MPTNNRNSRDDKSENFKRTPKRPGNPPKSSRTRISSSETPNNDRKKMFDDRPRRSEDGNSERPARPYAKKDFGSGKPGASGKPEGRSGGYSKPGGYAKPGGESSFSSDKRSTFGKGKPAGKFEKTDGAKRFEKGKTSATGRPFEKREGARPYAAKGDSFKRPFRKDERADFRDRGDSRDRGERIEHPGEKPGIRPKKTVAKDDGLIRLNRYISNAGICSRRKADELIEAGVVSVNGTPVSELGCKVNPKTDVIRYNGEVLKREKMVYVLLNKPKDYITTTDDPHERHTVMQLVEKASNERIYPVGRLDRNTTGLLLLTNDGDLTDKLSHPKNNITKIYNVELNKNLSQGDLNKISFGLELEDGLIKPDAVKFVEGGSKREVGIQIHSGKNRIVRRIFEHLGYEVVKLDRVIYANLTKKDLPRGRWRYLEEREVIQLKHLI